MLAWEIARKQDEEQSAWPHFILITCIFASEVLLVASNSQRHELPLLALAALYGAETIRRQMRLMTGDGFVAVRNSGAALLLLFFLLPTLATDFKTMRYSVRVSRGGTIAPETWRSRALKDFRFDPDGSCTVLNKEYIAILDEATQLLRRNITPQMRLNVLTISDPYNLALGLPPIEGGLVSWGNYELSQRSHPTLQRMVGDATHILADRGCARIKSVYGSEWDALGLEVVEETRNSTLVQDSRGADRKGENRRRKRVEK